MSRLSLALSFSLLVLSCSASARTMPYPHIDETPGATVQVRAPAATATITPDQAQQLAGAYVMSNGWQLKVQPLSWHTIEARIDDQKPMRMRAVAANTFVSRDGNVTMEFNRGAYGDEMTLRYVPDPLTAQVVVISTRMAQR